MERKSKESGIGIFDILKTIFNLTEEEQNKKEKDNIYEELEEWQKKEVDKGNYDSTSFEEEELEEDDYYSEDD